MVRNRQRRSSPLGAIILILVGSLFLLRAANMFDLTRQFWALLILVPAVLMLFGAFQSLRTGQSRPAIGRALGGLILLGVVANLLFGFNLGDWWPLLLIVAGALSLIPSQAQHQA